MTGRRPSRRTVVVISVLLLSINALVVWQVVGDDARFDADLLLPPTAAGDDGYPEWRRAFNTVVRWWPRSSDSVVCTRSFRPGAVESADVWLATARQQMLDDLLSASRSPFIRIPPGADPTYDRHVTSTLCTLTLSARMALVRGDANRYVDHILAAVRISLRTQEGSSSFAWWRTAMHALKYTLKVIREHVCDPHLEGRHLRSLLTGLSELHVSEQGYQRAIHGEYLEYASYVDFLDGLPGDDREYQGNLLNRVNFKPHRTQRIRARRARFWQRNTPLRFLDCAPHEPEFAHDPLYWIRGNQVGRMIEAKHERPKWNIHLEHLYLGRADLASTIAVVALATCEIERGALPLNLEELVPEYLDSLPRDPFGGEIVHYEPERRLVRCSGLSDDRSTGLSTNEWSTGAFDTATATRYARNLSTSCWVRKRGRSLVDAIMHGFHAGRGDEAFRSLVERAPESLGSDSSSLDRLAWLLVNPVRPKPDHYLPVALQASAAACGLTSEQVPSYLHTLARVHYRLGDVKRAVELQLLAIERTEPGRSHAQLDEALHEYRANSSDSGQHE